MSNKRIALVDDELFKPFTFYGLGFSDVVVLSQLKLSADRSSVSVSDGDGIYLIGKEAYDYFKEFNHLGVRGENAYDTSFLPRIGLHNGAFVKVAYKTAPTRAELNYFLSDEFTKKVHFDFSGVIVKSYQQAIPFLNYFSSYPGELGFDYETDGFATMPNFVITGASLATCTNGAFFDFEAIERTSTKEEWIKFQQEFGDLLEKRQNDLWAYNLQFEQMVTFRVFGKDIEINDSSVYNVIQGHHYKKYSLKYTANRVLGTNSWDDDFDKLNDIIGAMYKDPDITQSNYQQSSYFAEIVKEYPDYKDEFIRLINTYWGRSYRNIPGDILGKYCNLDAFYTLAIHLILKDGYTNVCHQIYMDNARLGARLHSGGMYKNEEYRQKYYTECHRMMVYGMTYITTCLCKLKVDEFSEAMKVLQDSGYGISKSEEVLLKRDELYKGDMKNIARAILLNNLNEESPTGMDDQKIIDIYGSELYEAVSAGLSDAGVTYVDMSIKRKKKPFDAIINRLLAVFNMPDQDTAKKHYSKPEYEKVVGYYFYKAGYDGFLDIWKNQMPDIDHIPYTFNFKGEIYSIEQFHDYLNNNYYNCTSPVEYPKIYNFFTEKYKYPLAFLSTLTIHRKIYDGTFKKSPSEDFKDFMDNIQNQPKEVIATLTELLSNPLDDRMTYLMNGLDGFLKINDFWKYYTKDAEKVRSYGLPYSEDDFNDQFDFLAKFGVLQHIYKRYRKMFTTYVMGLFKGFDRKCHDTEALVPDIIDEEDPRCTVTKMFPRYEIE